MFVATVRYLGLLNYNTSDSAVSPGRFLPYFSASWTCPYLCALFEECQLFRGPSLYPQVKLKKGCDIVPAPSITHLRGQLHKGEAAQEGQVEPLTLMGCD